MKTYKITCDKFETSLSATCGAEAMVMGCEQLGLLGALPKSYVPVIRARVGEAGCFPVVDAITGCVLFVVTQC